MVLAASEQCDSAGIYLCSQQKDAITDSGESTIQIINNFEPSYCYQLIFRVLNHNHSSSITTPSVFTTLQTVIKRSTQKNYRS